MIKNHDLLKELTVSSKKFDMFVETALSNGASGAKLSGGGRGGNMIALVEERNINLVEKALIDAGATRIINTEVR